MAEDFVLNARLNLLPPNNVADFKRQLQRSLDGITIDKTLTNEISAIRNSLSALTKDFNNIGSKIVTTGSKAATSLKKPKEEIDNISKAVRTGTKELYTFDEQIGVTVRRTAAFAVAAGAIYKTVTALRDGATAAIEYQKELVRLGQIGNDSRDSIRGLSNDISKLSRGFGVDSVQLIKAASQLRQAGLSLEKVRSSLAGLAKSTLTPSFGDLGDTTQGLIAILNQFQNSGKNVEAILSQINEVSKAYASESSDYIIAVQRAGGAFEQAGGSLEELLALFTTARAATRLSADTIGTAFNTIFNRVQRPEIIQQLQDLGIQLRFSAAEAENLGKVGIKVNADDFIGPYQAIIRISERLRKESTRGPLFGQTLEDIVGLRQIPKAIPLLRDLAKTQEALNVIRRSSTTLDRDSISAQQALAVQLNKLREGFVDFFKELGNNKLLSSFVSNVLDLAQALTELSKVLIPLAPYLAILSGIKIASGISSIANTALRNPIARGTSLIPLKRANKGGYIVPGTGNTDTVPANLEAGSFVLRKSASQKLLRRSQGGNVPALLTPGELVFPPKEAQRIGYANLSRMNKFAKGGQVPKRLFKIPPKDNKELFGFIKKNPLLRKSLELNEEFNNTLGAQVLNNTEAPLQTGPIPYITMGVAEMLKKKLGFAKGGEIPDYGTFAQSLGISFKEVQKYVQSLKLEGNKFISKKTPLSDANYSRLLEFFRPSRTFIAGASPSIADPLGALPVRLQIPQKETIVTSASRAIQPISSVLPNIVPKPAAPPKKTYSGPIPIIGSGTSSLISSRPKSLILPPQKESTSFVDPLFSSLPIHYRDKVNTPSIYTGDSTRRISEEEKASRLGIIYPPLFIPKKGPISQQRLDKTIKYISKGYKPPDIDTNKNPFNSSSVRSIGELSRLSEKSGLGIDPAGYVSNIYENLSKKSGGFSARGSYSSKKGIINLKPGLEGVLRKQTLLHEFGHSIFDKLLKDNPDKVIELGLKAFNSKQLLNKKMADFYRESASQKNPATKAEFNKSLATEGFARLVETTYGGGTQNKALSKELREILKPLQTVQNKTKLSREQGVGLLSNLAHTKNIHGKDRELFLQQHLDQLVSTGSIDIDGQQYNSGRRRSFTNLFRTNNPVLIPKSPSFGSRVKGLGRGLLSGYGLSIGAGLISEGIQPTNNIAAGAKGGLQSAALGGFAASALGLGGPATAAVVITSAFIGVARSVAKFDDELKQTKIDESLSKFGQQLDNLIKNGNLGSLKNLSILTSASRDSLGLGLRQFAGSGEGNELSDLVAGRGPGLTELASIQIRKLGNLFQGKGFVSPEDDERLAKEAEKAVIVSQEKPTKEAFRALDELRGLYNNVDDFFNDALNQTSKGEPYTNRVKEALSIIGQNPSAPSTQQIREDIRASFRIDEVTRQVNKQIYSFNALTEAVNKSVALFNNLDNQLSATIPTFETLQGSKSNLASTVNGFNIPKNSRDFLFNGLNPARNNPLLNNFEDALSRTGLAQTAIPEAIRAAQLQLSQKGGVGGSFSQLFKGALGNQLGDENFTNRLTSIIATLTEGEDKTPGKFLREFNINPKGETDKILELLLPDGDKTVKGLLEKYDEIFNSVSTSLTKNQSLINRTRESGFAFDNLQLNSRQTNSAFLNRRLGRGSDATIGLSYNQSLVPFIRRQESLTGLRGNQATDPQAIANKLSDVQTQIINTNQKITDAVDPISKLSAELERGNLVSSAQNLQKALENLADASSRNAILQDKINAIEEDRAGRLGFTKSFIAQSPEERQRTLLASQYTGQALRRGTVAGYDAETQQAIISFLESLGNSRLAGFGQITANDALNNLLKDANVRIAGAFGLNNEGNQERLQRQFEDAIRLNNDIAEQAASRLTEVFDSEQQSFFDQLNANLSAINKQLAIDITQAIQQVNAGQAKAAGGFIAGGIPGRDSVHARLMPGEFVVNKNATSKNRNFLKSINSGKLAFGTLRNDQEPNKNNLDIVSNKKSKTIYAADGGFFGLTYDPRRIPGDIYNSIADDLKAYTPTGTKLADLRRISRGNQYIREEIAKLGVSHSNIGQGIDDFNLSRHLDYNRLNRKIGSVRQNISKFNEESNVYKNSDSFRRVQDLSASTQAYTDRQNATTREIFARLRKNKTNIINNDRQSNNIVVGGNGPIQLGPEQALLASDRRKEEMALQKQQRKNQYKKELSQTIINKRLRNAGVDTRKERDILMGNPLGIFGSLPNRLLSAPSLTPSKTPSQLLKEKTATNVLAKVSYEDELRRTITKRKSRERQNNFNREVSQNLFGEAPHFQNRNEAYNFYNGPLQKVPHFKSKREAYFYYNNPNNFSGFANGGNVPRGTDTVPAVLTPGEFIVNAQSTKKYRNLLERINKDRSNGGGNIQGFQNGGEVKSSNNFSFDSFEKSIQLFNNTSEKFGISLNSFVSSLSTFGSQTQELINSLSNVKISIERKGTVEVVLNGAQVLANIKGDLEEYVVDRIKQAVGDLKNDIKYNTSTA